LFGFTAAQLAQKLLFRFKRPASELPLVTVIADFVRTAMASIAIGDSGVRRRWATEPKQDPKRQRELPKRVKKFRHKNCISTLSVSSSPKKNYRTRSSKMTRRPLMAGPNETEHVLVSEFRVRTLAHRPMRRS
jgi:hypothetical protein